MLAEERAVKSSLNVVSVLSVFPCPPERMLVTACPANVGYEVPRFK